MIKVLFFASVRDQLGVSELQVTNQDNTDLDSLLANLIKQGTVWNKALNTKSLMMAINQTMVSSNCALKDGDEVAFFPVVTGG
ncbi:molybdopterin converting factor subunit 1 [Psychromonas sp. PT13]|uniref:molybdopterin converting factor subunit 1 n=1 Tax=Psychromonas sp. PT13 TaxID=3439547 RepID=UPI003EC0E83F